jgi:small subunit ribosomal protein S20
LPNTKSAQKEIKVSSKKQRRNKPIRKMVKTNVTGARELISRGELDSAREAVLRAVRALDKAAQKGVIHPNSAARRKSHLMTRLNVISGESDGEN